jgi:hypothetical protein
MKKIILIVFTLLFVSFASQAQTQKPKKEKLVKDVLMEGKRFVINVSDDSKRNGKPQEDNITFKGGKFKSKLMEEEHGFQGCIYKVISGDSTNMDQKKYVFEAIQKLEGGDNDETLNWTGNIDGEDIEGTIIWVKKGKTKKEYSYYGGAKSKK